MELRWLRTFVAVASELNYSRAALRLHVSQPAVSQQIRQLETSVGVRLIERSTRAVSLTRAGEAFLPLARETIDKAEEAVRAARNSERDDQGLVRIGFAGAMGAASVAQISRLVRQRHPGIELHFRAQLGSTQVIDMLTGGALDIGFTAGQRPVRGLRSRVISVDSFAVLAPTDHPLAGSEGVELASLSGEPFVFLDEASGLQLRVEGIEACIDAGFRPRIAQEAPDTGTVFALVAGGAGLAVLPEGFAAAVPGTSVVPITDVHRALRTAVLWRDDPGFGRPPIGPRRDWGRGILSSSAAPWSTTTSPSSRRPPPSCSARSSSARSAQRAACWPRSPPSAWRMWHAPLGAIVFGGLGDRIGRKRTLMITLNLMGIATFLVGLVPDFATIGIAAPIILVVLRLLQGLSAGGEQAGSNSLSLEHAPSGKRGLYASWTMQGTALGTLLASVAFIAATAMPQEALLSWGWRIPFLISGPLLLVTFFIRKGVEETSAFLETKEARQEAKVPLAYVLRHHWAAVLRVIGCSFLAVAGSTSSVYALGYATGTVKIPAATMLVVGILGGVVGLIAQPLWALLSDRVGRRPIFAASMVLTAVLFFPYFWALSTGNIALVFIGSVVLGIVATGANAVGASFYTEMFPTRVRYTGAAIGTQLGFLVAGFAPAIEQAVQGQGATGWVPVAVFAGVCMLVAAVSAWTARETSHTSLDEIDSAAVAR